MNLLTPPADLSHFWVIAVISNPIRYKRRYELYRKFESLCRHAGVNLITVEVATGERSHIITHDNDPKSVRLRSVEELWFKENMIDIGAQRAMQIDPKCREIAWVDADCMPMVPPREWFEETWHQLQHYEFVQMWEYMIDAGPGGEPISKPQPSFIKTYIDADYEVKKAKSGIKHTLAGHSGVITLGRPGLAWAANVSAYNAVGGLIDFCILGSGDWHMAHGLVGAMDQGAWEFGLTEYAQSLLDWQAKAERYIKRDVGYVPVSVIHWFHGKKVNRQYGSRGGILVRNQYNPKTDIKYDAQGLLQLETHEPRQIRLRNQIRSYFRQRNEDSIDL